MSTTTDHPYKAPGKSRLPATFRIADRVGQAGAADVPARAAGLPGTARRGVLPIPRPASMRGRAPPEAARL